MRRAYFQQGVALVEAAAASVVFGIAALVLWQFLMSQTSQQARDASNDLLERSDKAVLAFAFIHQRLPCPAASDGAENCDGRTTGRLPYLTIGLPEHAAARVDYTVGAKELTTAAPDAFQVLIPDVLSDGPDAVRAPLRPVAGPAYDGGLDLCAALGHAGSPGASSKELAFRLEHKPADAAAGAWAPFAETLSRSASRASVWSALGCAPWVSASGRAHFNAALASAAFVKTMGDYRRQLGLYNDILEWDLGQSVWFEVNSAANTLKTLIKLHLALSAVFLAPEDPTKMAPVVKSSTLLPIVSLHTLALVSNFGRFIYHLDVGMENKRTAESLHANAIATAAQVARNARLSAGSASFLAEQTAPALADVPVGRAPEDPRENGRSIGEISQDYVSALR